MYLVRAKYRHDNLGVALLQRGRTCCAKENTIDWYHKNESTENARWWLLLSTQRTVSVRKVSERGRQLAQLAGATAVDAQALGRHELDLGLGSMQGQAAGTKNEKAYL